MNTKDLNALGIPAQADMHHALWLGLQLMIASNCDRRQVYDWIFRLFRRQHKDKFISSFGKLGLTGLPDAVACARYHVMANSIGGVPVEYLAESDTKAWVRFRYPRWMYLGATICGIPVEVSRGFLDGWYAENGVSLNNPRLGFVCVSEDMTGEFGLCGYFKEFDHDLMASERLQFANERPPLFYQEDQPTLPAGIWSDERLQKANRNYAMDFVRNGIIELHGVIGDSQTKKLAGRAARLIGLQYFFQTRALIRTEDGDLASAGDYLSRMFAGLGDKSVVQLTGNRLRIVHSGLRITQGLEAAERVAVLTVWKELWLGALASFQRMKHAEVEIREDSLVWTITEAPSQ